MWRALVAWAVDGPVVVAEDGDSVQRAVIVSTAHTMDVRLVILPDGGTANDSLRPTKEWTA